MIDYFSLALTHALLIIALLRLIKRAEIDREEPYTPMSEAELARHRQAQEEEAFAKTPAGRRKRHQERQAGSVGPHSRDPSQSPRNARKRGGRSGA